MNKFIKIFRDFIPRDKSYIKYWMDNCYNVITEIGKILDDRKEYFTIYTGSGQIIKELVEFIDGNGFLVEPVDLKRGVFITVKPIYPEETIVIEFTRPDPELETFNEYTHYGETEPPINDRLWWTYTKVMKSNGVRLSHEAPTEARPPPRSNI